MVAMMGDTPDPRWLVTINGRVVTDTDLTVLHQDRLAMILMHRAAKTNALLWRSEFYDEDAAMHFHAGAAREFPEDDVRLWASVDTDGAS